MRFYRDYVATAPDEVNSLVFCGHLPASEHFPAEIHGRPFIVFGAQYARLAQIKAKYDPTNLFRLNQNIKPRP